jgi:drug/metabolite transporter (DMT)-like permease
VLDPRPLIAVVLWGGIYPAAKVALRDLPFLSFTGLRVAMAAVLLLLVAGGGLARRLPSTDRGQLLAAGLAQTAFQLLLVAGVAFAGAGETAILVATAPLMTAVWSTLVRRQRLARRQWCGFLLGLLGVGLIVRPERVEPMTGAVVGDLLALGAAAAWAWYSLAVGPVVAALGSVRATAVTMAIAAALITPLALPQIVALHWQAVPWRAWAGLAYGATFGMAVAMVLWGAAVHRLGATRTMIYAYLEPASAVIIAAVLLGESLAPGQMIGALVVFAGVWLAV